MEERGEWRTREGFLLSSLETREGFLVLIATVELRDEAEREVVYWTANSQHGLFICYDICISIIMSCFLSIQISR